MSAGGIVAVDAATMTAKDASTLISEVVLASPMPAELALQMVQAQAACAQAWALIAIARELGAR